MTNALRTTTFKFSAALAALAALGLAAAPTARAQSLLLNSGDNVTVNGNGTHGTIGGMPVANPTASYTTPGGPNDDGNSPVVETDGTSILNLGAGGAITETSGIQERIGLNASGSGAVTVTGGTITVGHGQFGMVREGSGPVNINGGVISAGDDGSGLFAVGSGPINISGGTFSTRTGGAGLDAFGSSAVTISGGTFSCGADGDGLFNTGTGPVTVSGGTFSAGADGVAVVSGGNSTGTVSSGPFISISGGTFSAGAGGIGLLAQDKGTITVTGGTITAGQGGYGLSGGVGGSIDLYGSFIDPAGHALMPGQIENLSGDPKTGLTGSFFGTLENNTTSQTFTYENYGTITLHAVALAAPEPSQFTALGVGLLGLFVLALRARRRRSIA